MEMSDSISRDELVVLQLLEEIQQLVDLAGGETKPGEDINPRMHPAAKLYLDTRDTFEVIENLVEEHVKGKPKLLRRLSKQSSSENVGASAPKSSHESPTVSVLNDAVIDRIQEMFRHLGSLLGPSILKELRLRKLSITSILHYVRFLPMEYQWTAYKEARKEEVELVYRETVFNSLSSQPPYTRGATQTLRHRAEFVKHQIRNDVDTVCLFAADGTLSTIFGDDGDMVEENVAIKFESLIADVYSSYLRDSLDVQMKHLTQISDQWAHDTAVTASSKHTAETGPPLIVQCFYRPRKFRMKGGIFPEMLMNLVNRFVHLPPVHSGQQAKLLVADPHHVGVWWQKSIFSVSERDVSTLHDDESRDIFGKIETLDGQLYVPLLRKEQDGSRLFGRGGGLAKWVGQRVLVNNGKDSVWVEVVVVDVDDKRCKLQMKKSLLKCVDVSSWAQFLSLNEWVNLRELHFIGAPVNPHFRVQMGLKFREVVESVQAVVVDISSVFSNGELNDKGFVFRMQLLLEYVNNTVLVGYERNLGVHEKVYELAVRMLLDVLTCIAEAYENLVASRARQGQWKIDILYLVCGVYKLLRQLGQMFSSRGATQSAKGKRKAINDIRCICLRLLVHLAIRSGPASVVLDTLANKVQADSFEQYADVDTISEMEYHVVSIVQSVDPDGDILGDFGNDESEKELGRIHTVFGSMEIKKLLDVQLNWTALISRSSLPKQTLLGILQQRHELGDWPFPALTEAELQARSRIQQFIDQLSDNTGVSEQEEHDVTAPEQPSNNTSQDNDNNSHPRDTSGEPSLNLPP
ncbi:hypothetical protein PC120_g11750 [Phytophthora cactorum]|nr:hypothetical protein PC120_g11750 [Phytophthora cactorum]